MTAKSSNSTVDIGVDFDSINRKEKLKEKKAINAPAPMSTITMSGKAMGSGSGIGRSGATSIPPQNHMMTPQMGMGAPGMNLGMGGYARGQPMGMGIGQGGAPMQPGFGMPQGQTMPRGVGYNPMLGMGGNNYGSQQPYGGG